jgi:hypothetical protein
VKSFFPEQITLGPVRRAAAFFACLAALTLASCGEDSESPAALMAEQVRVFEEMAVVLNEVAAGGDQGEAAEKLTRLGKELKDLKARLSENEELKEGATPEILDLSDFQKATAARQEAFENVLRSVKMTPELQRSLMAHHNPAPLPGEGAPK